MVKVSQNLGKDQSFPAFLALAALNYFYVSVLKEIQEVAHHLCTTFLTYPISAYNGHDVSNGNGTAAGPAAD